MVIMGEEPARQRLERRDRSRWTWYRESALFMGRFRRTDDVLEVCDVFSYVCIVRKRFRNTLIPSDGIKLATDSAFNGARQDRGTSFGTGSTKILRSSPMTCRPWHQQLSRLIYEVRLRSELSVTSG